jgi:hypothetical protein
VPQQQPPPQQHQEDEDDDEEEEEKEEEVDDQARLRDCEERKRQLLEDRRRLREDLQRLRANQRLLEDGVRQLRERHERLLGDYSNALEDRRLYEHLYREEGERAGQLHAWLESLDPQDREANYAIEFDLLRMQAELALRMRDVAEREANELRVSLHRTSFEMDLAVTQLMAANEQLRQCREQNGALARRLQDYTRRLRDSDEHQDRLSGALAQATRELSGVEEELGVVLEANEALNRQLLQHAALQQSADTRIARLVRQAARRQRELGWFRRHLNTATSKVRELRRNDRREKRYVAGIQEDLIRVQRQLRGAMEFFTAEEADHVQRMAAASADVGRVGDALSSVIANQQQRIQNEAALENALRGESASIYQHLRRDQRCIGQMADQAAAHQRSLQGAQEQTRRVTAAARQAVRGWRAEAEAAKQQAEQLRHELAQRQAGAQQRRRQRPADATRTHIPRPQPPAPSPAPSSTAARAPPRVVRVPPLQPRQAHPPPPPPVTWLRNRAFELREIAARHRPLPPTRYPVEIDRRCVESVVGSGMHV